MKHIVTLYLHSYVDNKAFIARNMPEIPHLYSQLAFCPPVVRAPGFFAPYSSPLQGFEPVEAPYSSPLRGFEPVEEFSSNICLLEGSPPGKPNCYEGCPASEDIIKIILF